MDDAARFQQLFARLGETPALYPYQFDLARGLALMVEMDRSAYREAAFLDERMLGPQSRGGWVPLDELGRRVGRDVPARPLHFIFHVGHCGSTLISRLLGELDSCLSLREPLVLLELAAQYRQRSGEFDARTWGRHLEVTLRLLGRTFSPAQQTLVKATSSCANMASTLVLREPQGRAILLYVSLETYLATMLRAPATRVSAREQGALWAQDLAAVTGEPSAEALDDAAVIAMDWAMAMRGLDAAARAAPEHVQWLDFDAFLADPAAHLSAGAGALGLAADTATLEALVSGPLMDRYAKLPEQQFDAAARGRELAASRSRHADEISAGRAWLDAQAQRYPALGDLLESLARIAVL